MAADGGARATRVANTHARIAEAALDLFVEHGFAATTVDQIAEAAGIGRRSFFRYFPTKEAVLFSGFELPQQWVLDHLRGAPADEPPLVTLITVFRDVAARPMNRTRQRKVRHVVSRDPALQAAQQLDMVDRFAHRLVDSLLESHPDLTADDVTPLVGISLNWLEAAIRQHIGDGGRTALEYFDEIVELCVNACLDLSSTRRS